MDVNQAYELGRHYDNLLWTVAGILGAAIAGLLAYSYERETLSLGPPLLGVALTLASVFFACGWRSLRRRLNDYLQSKEQEDIKYVLSHPLFKQWPVFLFLHIVVLWAWVSLLNTHHPARRCIWCSVGIAGTLFIVAWGLMADYLPLERHRGKGSA